MYFVVNANKKNKLKKSEKQPTTKLSLVGNCKPCEKFVRLKKKKCVINVKQPLSKHSGYIEQLSKSHH